MTVERYHMAANTVIRASAGTGKTYALVETATHLLAGLTHLEAPLAPRELVAITFTERAAGEMLERIRLKVQKLAIGNPMAAVSLRQSAELLGRDLPSCDHWQRVLHEIDELRFCTFHSFCLTLLQRYPLESGLDPAFGVFDEEAAIGRIEEIVELELLAALQQGEQRAGLQALLGLVGLKKRGDFGTGLIDVLPNMLAQVYEAGLDLETLRERIGGPTPGPTETDAPRERDHALLLCELLRRVDVRFTDEKRRLAQVDFTDMQRYARDLLRQRTDIRELVKGRIGVLLVDEFQDTNPVQRDITLLLAEEPDENPEWTGADAVRLGAQRLFVVGDPKQAIYNFRGADVAIFNEVERYVLLQGGQRFALETSYRSRPLLVEGANTYFERLLGAVGESGEPWAIGWSDSAALVADRDEEIRTPAVHLVDSEALCVERRPRFRSSAAALLKQDEECGAISELILDLVHGPTPWRVEDDDGPRDARFGDITVLLRRVQGALNELLYQFDRRGIPHYVVKGGGFFAAREVIALTIGLRAMADPADSPSLVAWLRGPLVGLSDDALALMARAYRRRPTAGTVMHAADSPTLAEQLTVADQCALRAAADMLRRIGSVGERVGPAEVVRLLLDTSDYRAVLAALPAGDQALANLDRVQELADRYNLRYGNSLTGFARFLRKLVEQEPKTEAFQTAEEHHDVVRIMSIHQSKGLDCRIGIIPEADWTPKAGQSRIRFSPRLGIGVKVGDKAPSDSIYERIKAEQRSREHAEHRRLMYVAMTRARDHVVVSGKTLVKKAKAHQSGDWAVSAARDQVGWYQYLLELKADAPEWLQVHPVEHYLNRRTRVREARPEPPPTGIERTIRTATAGPRSWGGDLVSAVTQIIDFAICHRRYWLEWEVGMTDPVVDPEIDESARELLPEAERLGGQTEWPADPVDLGTLAHGLLERADVSHYRSLAGPERSAYLGRLALTLGTPVAPESRDPVVESVSHTLEGELGDLLLDGHVVERESGFMLHLPSGDLMAESALFLRGRIDLLVQESPDAPIRIIDYKFSRGASDISRYELQLLTYALAVHRRLGSPDSISYRAGIVFLREARPEVRELPRVITSAELEAHARRMGQLGSDLIEARHTDRWPRLELDEVDATCLKTACRFRRVCFPDHAFRRR